MPTTNEPTNKDEITVYEAHEIKGFEETHDNIQLLKTTLTAARTDLTDAELKLFLYQVKRTALDPLARQIYVMKNGGKLSFITSIDGYRLVAERSGKYMGQTKTEWEFDDDGKLLNATVGVIKKVGDDKDTTYATAWFDEYAKDLDKYYSMWKKMPKTMIAKVAESLALRKAFPQELGGVYTEEEMQQAQETTTTQASPQPKTYDPNEFPPEPVYNPDDQPNPKSRIVPNKAKYDELAHAFDEKLILVAADKVAFVKKVLGKPMPSNDDEVDKVISAINALTE